MMAIDETISCQEYFVSNFLLLLQHPIKRIFPKIIFLLNPLSSLQQFAKPPVYLLKTKDTQNFFGV